MAKQAKNVRISNTRLNSIVTTARATATGNEKFINLFRKLVSERADVNDTLKRMLMRIDSVCSGATLKNDTETGHVWGYVLEAYRTAYAETGFKLERVSNAKLKDYKVDYKVVKHTPAARTATPQPASKPAVKQQAATLHDILPFATGLSTGKLKKALADTDAVSAILLAARIVEAATGQRAAFQAVLNEYTTQKGETRTLKTA